VHAAILLPRSIATVQAHTKLTCLVLGRDDFVQMLGPLQKLMEREKSPQVRRAGVWWGPWKAAEGRGKQPQQQAAAPLQAGLRALSAANARLLFPSPFPYPQVIAQRLSKLATFKRHGAGLTRAPAEVLLKRQKRGRNGEIVWEVVRARGHLDEVQELTRGGSKLGERRRRGAGGGSWGRSRACSCTAGAPAVPDRQPVTDLTPAPSLAHPLSLPLLQRSSPTTGASAPARRSRRPRAAATAWTRRPSPAPARRCPR
jgi:hypothetical protein